MKRSRLTIVLETNEQTHIPSIEHVEPEPHSSGSTISYESPSVPTESAGNSNSDEPATKKKKNYWNILKPKHHNRLFYDICYADEIEFIVHSWVDSYEVDPEAATIRMIQLIIDICGYQDFKIQDIMKQQEWYCKVGKILEKTPHPDIDNTNKYFLDIRTKTVKKYLEKLDYFLIHVIMESHRRQIFNESENWLRYACLIIRDISLSKKTNILHTGVYFGLKFITGLTVVGLKLYRRQMKFSEMSDEENKAQAMHDIKAYSKKINKYYQVLYCSTLQKYWNLYCPKLYHMRFDCINEIAEWFNYLPVYMIPFKQLFKILEGAGNDPHKEVRFKTLQIMHNLVSDEYRKRYSFIQELFKEIVTNIFKRTFDKDITVAVYAIDILNNIDNNIQPIPNKLRNQIYYYIYNDNNKFASAAGRFLLTKLTSQSTTDQEILLNLVRFQINIEQKEDYENMEIRRGLVVDHLYQQTPVLSDIETYVTLLKKPDLIDLEKTILAEFLLEILQIFANGRFSNSCIKQPAKIDQPRYIEILKLVCMNIILWYKSFSYKYFKYLYKFMEEFKEKCPEDFSIVQKKFNEDIARYKEHLQGNRLAAPEFQKPKKRN